MPISWCWQLAFYSKRESSRAPCWTCQLISRTWDIRFCLVLHCFWIKPLRWKYSGEADTETQLEYFPDCLLMYFSNGLCQWSELMHMPNSYWNCPVPCFLAQISPHHPVLCAVSNDVLSWHAAPCSACIFFCWGYSMGFLHPLWLVKTVLKSPHCFGQLMAWFRVCCAYVGMHWTKDDEQHVQLQLWNLKSGALCQVWRLFSNSWSAGLWLA